MVGQKSFAEVDPETMGRILFFRSGPNRKTLKEIAGILNSEGSLSKHGRSWSIANLHHQLKSAGLSAGRPGI